MDLPEISTEEPCPPMNPYGWALLVLSGTNMSTAGIGMIEPLRWNSSFFGEANREIFR